MAEVAAGIASLVQLEKAAGWDPIGLQLGNPDAPVERVAVCHEVTPPVVVELIDRRIDLVVAYHPLLFRPVTHLVAGSGPAGRAFDLVANGIALSVVHTAFDVMAGGTADALAGALDLEAISGFGPAWGAETAKVITFAPTEAADAVAAAMAAAGAGRIGDYSNCSFRTEGTGVFLPAAGANPYVGSADRLNRVREVVVEMICPTARTDSVVSALVNAHPYEEPAYDVVTTKSNAGFIGRRGTLATPSSVSELATIVEQRLGGIVRVAGSGAVSTVAVIPGSGGSFLAQCAADVVVTGDVSHHQARAATDMALAVIDPGHAATERPGVQALYAAVAETVDAVDLTAIDNDPWKER